MIHDCKKPRGNKIEVCDQRWPPTQLNDPSSRRQSELRNSEVRKGSGGHQLPPHTAAPGCYGQDANGNLEKYPSLLLSNIPLSSPTGGEVTAEVRTPSGASDHPEVRDNGNGSASVLYQV